MVHKSPSGQGAEDRVLSLGAGALRAPGQAVQPSPMSEAASAAHGAAAAATAASRCSCQLSYPRWAREALGPLM